MNNVPADVVKDMGADIVIAVNVGDLSDRENLSYTMLGLAGSTLDAMMRASTRTSLAKADVVLDVPLATYGSLDWRRANDLVAEGYQRCRGHARPVAAARGERSRVRGVAAGAPRPSPARGPRAGVRPGRGLRRQRRQAPGGAAAAACRRSARPLRDRDGSGGADRPRSLRDDHLAHDPGRGGPGRIARGGAAKSVRAAFHDARRQSREHDVAAISESPPRPGCWRSTSRARDPSCASTARWDRIRASQPSGIARSGARHCSWRRTPASPPAHATTSRTTR